MPQQGQPPDPRLPLVAPMENRNAQARTDQQMVNCFAEKTETGYVAVKRSGLSFSTQGTVGVGQGVVNFLDNLYSISGDTLNLNQTFSAGFSLKSAGAGFSPRVGVAAVGFLGKLWVMGGTTVSSGVPQDFNDVFSSLDGIAWNRVSASAPWGPRAYASAIVFNGKMYITGGVTSDANPKSYGDVWSTSDGNTWVLENVRAFPGRFKLGFTTFNNKMWVAGGRAQQTNTVDGTQTGYYNDVWSSVDGRAWVQMNANSPWLPRCNFGFAGYNGKLIVLAGELPDMWKGAAPDYWTSSDGVTWTRSNSNPFGQGVNGVFGRAVMTSLGTGLSIPPTTVTISGGGGSGAVGAVDIIEEDEEGADTGGIVSAVRITAPGSGYNSAPAIAFTNYAGTPLTGYTMLQAGINADKRGMCFQTGATLYYYVDTTTNNAPTSEIWQTTDGVAWSLSLSSFPFSPRDTIMIPYGTLWVFGGLDATGYKNDVWSGSLNALSAFALNPVSLGLNYTFAQTAVSITSPLIFFKSTKDAYSYNPNTTILTTVRTQPNFPSLTVPGIVYLDGYFIVMDSNGKIWNSAINDPTTWTALGVIAAQSEPNGGVAIAKLASYLVAFGVWSTTFFYDAAVAAPASPLAVNDSLASIIGCANGDSVVEAQNTIIWIGQSKKEARGVYVFENYSPVRISTPFIDRILQADDLSNVRAFATEGSGHTFYVLTLLRSNITLVYDFESKNWGIWTSRQPSPTIVLQSLTCDAYGLVTCKSPGHGLTDGDPITVATASIEGYNGPQNVFVSDQNTFQYILPATLGPASGVAQAIRTSEAYFYCKNSAQVKGVNYLQHESSGIVFRFMPDSYTDFGNPIDVRVTTPNWDGGNRRRYKFLYTLDLLADNVSSSCLVRYSDNDYLKWSLFRTLDLSLTRVRTNRLGRFHRRAFQIRHTAATPFRAEALELTAELE